MNHADFLQLVWNNFHRNDAWPLARDLQAQVRQKANIRLLAAQVGLKLVVCEEGQDGICLLRLRGIALCQHSDEDIENVLAAVRLTVKHSLTDGLKPIESTTFGQELKLVPRDVRRLGMILYRTGGSWGSVSRWASDGSQFSVTPGENAIFYEGVRTLDEFFRVGERVVADEIATSQLRLGQIYGDRGARSVEPATVQYLDTSGFGTRHPEALAKWKDAESRLSEQGEEAELTVIGHVCREAQQAFATSLLTRHPSGDAPPDVQKTVARLRAALASLSVPSDGVRAVLDALVAYWGTVCDLGQRQEHGAQREGETLAWEDARRLVFHTAFVMMEIDRVAQ
jgi:hypothetical protein